MLGCLSCTSSSSRSVCCMCNSVFSGVKESDMVPLLRPALSWTQKHDSTSCIQRALVQSGSDWLGPSAYGLGLQRLERPSAREATLNSFLNERLSWSLASCHPVTKPADKLHTHLLVLTRFLCISLCTGDGVAGCVCLWGGGRRRLVSFENRSMFVAICSKTISCGWDDNFLHVCLALYMETQKYSTDISDPCQHGLSLFTLWVAWNETLECGEECGQ